MSPIADGGGDRDERETDQSAEDAWKGGFHSSDHDEGIVGTQGGKVAKGPMNPGNPNVIKTGGSVTQKFQGDVGLFRNGVI